MAGWAAREGVLAGEEVVEEGWTLACRRSRVPKSWVWHRPQYGWSDYKAGGRGDLILSLLLGGRWMTDQCIMLDQSTWVESFPAVLAFEACFVKRDGRGSDLASGAHGLFGMIHRLSTYHASRGASESHGKTRRRGDTG